MNFDGLFPSPVWWEKTDINTSLLEQYAYKAQFEDTTGNKISNVGGWQSKNILGLSMITNELEGKILDMAHQALNAYSYDQTNIEPYIANLWININKKGHSNSVHIHGGCFLSGVFYIKAKPSQGGVCFYKDFNKAFIDDILPFKEANAINVSQVPYECETGKIITFPGYLPHDVKPNETDEDRISAAWNIKLRAKK